MTRLFAALSLLWFTPAAFADDEAAPEVEGYEYVPSGIPAEVIEAQDWPLAYVERTLTLPRGMVEVGADLDMLYVRGVQEDFFDTEGYSILALAPRVRFGLSSLFTIGAAQATRIVRVTDPSGEPMNVMFEGILRFLGDYDLAAHAMLTLNNGLSADDYSNSVEEAIIPSLRLALEGRVRFSAGRANFRFRTGFALQDLSNGPDFVPDIELQLLYQTSPTLMIGGLVGFTPMDWRYGVVDDLVVPLQLTAVASLTPTVDLVVRAGMWFGKPFGLGDEGRAAPTLAVGFNARL